MPDTKNCWKYNINANTWTQISTSTYVHHRQPGASYNNKLYFFNVNGQSEIFDPIRNTWTPWKSPPIEHGHHPCIITWRDSFIVIGGSSYGRGVQMYNHTTDTWKTLGAISVGDKSGQSCAQIPNSNGKYLIAGHFDAAIYDASNDSWRKIANTKYSRWLSSMVVLGKRMFVMGGETDTMHQHEAVEEYLVDKDVWEVKDVKVPVSTTLSAALSLPASWFDNKNLSTPFKNGCIGVL